MKNNRWQIHVFVDDNGTSKPAIINAASEDHAYVTASAFALDRSMTELDSHGHTRIMDYCTRGLYREAVKYWNTRMEAWGRDLSIITIDQETNHDTTNSNVDAQHQPVPYRPGQAAS